MEIQMRAPIKSQIYIININTRFSQFDCNSLPEKEREKFAQSQPVISANNGRPMFISNWYPVCVCVCALPMAQ